ncbi:MAG: glycosyltransferase family 4 protein [Chloroflexota bacterium]|nr:glycosyltransferase family 4 protein [Chloroflexota bacterium]
MTNQSRKLNVMQLILNLKREGAQEVVRTVSEYLAEDDCVPIVCTFSDGPVARDLEKLGIAVEVLGPRRYSVLALPWFLADMIRIRRQLAQLIGKHEIDVIQTHILEMLDFVTLNLRFKRLSPILLWTVHNVNFLPMDGTWSLKPKRYLFRWLYRLAANRINGFVAVSDEVQESMSKELPSIQNKIITISNGVNVRRYECSANGAAFYQQLALNPDARLITTVARLTTQKGHCHLIEAAPKIVSHYPDVHFLFIGHGELKESLKKQAQDLAVSQNIHFLGVRDDIPKILALSEIFVLPSLWEGLSIALLEAMASATPIVATAVSGTTQVMIPDETGLIVPPGDSQALAEAIIKMLHNPAEAQAMGEAAKKHVIEHYSAQKQADEHMALYRQLLSISK